MIKFILLFMAVQNVNIVELSKIIAAECSICPSEEQMQVSHTISESMDELERDIHSDMVRDNFFDRFSEELSDLSYMEMLDVLEMAKERTF